MFYRVISPEKTTYFKPQAGDGLILYRGQATISYFLNEKREQEFGHKGVVIWNKLRKDNKILISSMTDLIKGSEEEMKFFESIAYGIAQSHGFDGVTLKETEHLIYATFEKLF